MAPPRFRISTRQKADELVTLDQDDLLATGATFTSNVVRVAGYSGISILAIANASFTIRVEEACESGGDFALTQTFTSAADPAGLHFVCQRVVPCGIFAKIILENTSGAAQTTLSMCTTGLPEGGGGGVGPPGPPGPVGPPGVQTDHAATFVVNPAGGADFTTIPAALAALPAGGGCLFLREGTYPVAATIAMPASPVVIRGCGIGSVILAQGALVGATFSIPAGGFEYGFADFEVTATTGFDNRFIDATGSPEVIIERIKAATFRRVLVGGSPIYSMEDCDFTLESSTTARFTDLPGGGEVTAFNVKAISSAGGRGGVTGLLTDFILTDCEFGVRNIFNADELTAEGCTFDGGSDPAFLGEVTAATKCLISSCLFTNSAKLTTTANDSLIVGCHFSVSNLVLSTLARASVSGCTVRSNDEAIAAITVTAASSVKITGCSVINAGTSTTVLIDIVSGARAQVTGCVLSPTTAIAGVRTAGTDGTFTGNAGSEMTEVGAANRNRFSNNQDFAGSTIIGGASLVENENFRNVKTWGATGDGVTDDFAAIALAIAALPASGGVLYFPEGTYLISTTLTLPDKPVRILGAGAEATVIDIASNVIAAFTLASDRRYSFADFSMTGNNIVGQQGFFFGAAHFGAFHTIIDRVNMTAIALQLSLNAAAFAFIAMSDCQWDAGTQATRRTLSGATANLRAVDCLFSAGGFADDSDVSLTSCRVEMIRESAFGEVHFINCDQLVVGATGIVLASAVDFAIIGCHITELLATRFIDVPVTVGKGVIANNDFDGAGSAEDIRIAATNITVSDNVGSVIVTEIGGADSNRYANNAGFAGSTIIGPFSVINGMQTGSYTGDGTTGQVIALGIEPRFVKIWERATVDNTNIGIFETTPEIIDDNAAGGNAQHTASAAGHRFRTNQIVTLGAASFTVDDNGVNANPNTLGVVYNFLAKE